MFRGHAGSPLRWLGTELSTPIADDPIDARVYRTDLVRELAREIQDVRVLRAMSRVPRHLFVPEISLARAYDDRPAPIGYGQTISQPYIVARMTEALLLRGDERVLEIGTGSGYQTAVLSALGTTVYSIEVVRELAEEAKTRLARLGYDHVHLRIGDGYAGWPEEAPFDRIIVTAAPEEVPHTLLAQLGDGGILDIPVGPSDWTQRLLRYRKKGSDVSSEDLGAVRFVPMVSEEESGLRRTGALESEPGMTAPALQLRPVGSPPDRVGHR